MVQMISSLQVKSVKPIGDQDPKDPKSIHWTKASSNTNLNNFASRQFATDRKRRKRPLRVAVDATIQFGRSDPFVSLPWLLPIEA